MKITQRKSCFCLIDWIIMKMCCSQHLTAHPWVKISFLSPMRGTHCVVLFYFIIIAHRLRVPPLNLKRSFALQVRDSLTLIVSIHCSIQSCFFSSFLWAHMVRFERCLWIWRSTLVVVSFFFVFFFFCCCCCCMKGERFLQPLARG